MRITHNKNKLSFLLCMVLTAAMALTMAGCNDDSGSDSAANSEAPASSAAEESATEAETEAETAAQEDSAAETEAEASEEVTVLGEGATSFDFIVIDAEGTETAFEIHTDETVVGDALLALDLIAGDEGDYGLYVKSVNGITADFETDGTYWAFYIDGEYAMTGVDATEITADAEYTFKVEK